MVEWEGGLGCSRADIESLGFFVADKKLNTLPYWSVGWSVGRSVTNIFELPLFFVCLWCFIPAMAAVAVRKKVVSIGHFFYAFIFSHCNFFLLDQEQLYVLIALKFREKWD